MSILEFVYLSIGLFLVFLLGYAIEYELTEEKMGALNRKVFYLFMVEYIITILSIYVILFF